MHFPADPLGGTFEGGRQPVLLYITKQQFGGAKHDRPLHSHDNLCELLLVYHGYGSYTSGRQSFPIQEGDVLFSNVFVPHEVCSQSGVEIGTYCFAYFDLHLRGLERNCIIPQGGAPVRSSGVQFRFLQRLCEEAYQNFGSGPDGDTLAQCLATSFLLMAHALPEVSPASSNPEQDAYLVESILRYLDEHFTETVVLEDVAASFHCSASYVSHVFKRCTGYSPIHYVIRRRIGLAQTYLITTDYTVTRIATLVGYDNTNYFTTIFTKIVGLSPLRYKRQYLEAMKGKASP